MNSRHDSQRARRDGTQRIGHDPRRGASSPQWNREAQMEDEQFHSRHARPYESPYGNPYGGQYGGYENSRHAGAGFSGYGDYEEELDERWADDRRHGYGASEDRPGRIPNQFSPGGAHRHHDPDYAQWRQEQMQRLDEDYAAYRRERYEKFSQDFDAWRAGRARGANAPDEGSDAGGGKGGSKQQG